MKFQQINMRVFSKFSSFARTSSRYPPSPAKILSTPMYVYKTFCCNMFLFNNTFTCLSWATRISRFQGWSSYASLFISSVALYFYFKRNFVRQKVWFKCSEKDEPLAFAIRVADPVPDRYSGRSRNFCGYKYGFRLNTKIQNSIFRLFQDSNSDPVGRSDTVLFRGFGSGSDFSCRSDPDYLLCRIRIQVIRTRIRNLVCNGGAMTGLRLAGCCSLQDGQDEVNTRPLPPRRPSVLLASVLLHFGC